MAAMPRYRFTFLLFAGLEFISSDGQFRQVQVDDAVNDGVLQSKLLHNVSRPSRQPRWGHKGPGHVAARSNTSLGDCPAALGTFPFQECRDPNTAWTGSEKLIFLVSYAAFWLSICMIVYFWPRMSQLASRCTKRSRAATATTIDGIPRVGLLSEAGAELAGGLVDPCAGPMPPYPTERRLIELFEDRVKENPAAVALTVPGSTRPSKEITYGALNAAIDEVTDALLSCGITRGSVVALVLDRSVAQVVAVFGVLKAGAAFLPVDNDAPFARKQFLLLESESSALIAAQGDQPAVELASEVGLNFIALPTDGSLSTIQIQRLAGMRANSLVRQPSSPGGGIVSTGPVERIRPEASDMALLIYTSGTTGSPKGIVYDHQHLMHGVHFFATHCKMNSSSVGLLKSPYFWAIIEWEMFPALTLGGKLVVASASGHKSPDYLANTIAAEEVSVLMITPQVLDLVLDVHEAQGNARPLRSLKHIVTVGEPLTSALANRTVRMGRGLEAQLHNFYGASESSCTVYTVPKEGVDLSAFPTKAPAGLPQPHSKVYVMKVEELGGGAPPLLTPVSAGGEAGEICFGGVLAACYWKHDELTSQKWIDTQEYGRLYMTGDRGRWHHGVLEVVGRVDRQVKIRGVRVEPEEVEAVLKKFSAPVVEDLAALSSVDIEMELAAEGIPARNALKEVAVVASQEPSDLVAFVSIREGVGQVTSEALRAHCQANLTPSYVPKFIVILEDLPKLPNGKPNLRELSSMASEHVVEEGEMVMDSLGQMKKLSKWAVFENAVIHRCYAWWMIGVLTDHYMRCAIDQDENTQFYPFCTTLARSSVKPWAEIIIRSIGNDQDLFGFIMLGAYQDSRPAIPGGPAKVNLGLKDLFVFVIYVAMALPIAQGMHLVFGSWAWPIDWGSHGAPTNEWDYNYMEVNSYTSDHRWYLAMVLSARVYLEIMEKFRAPAWLQGALATIPCFIDPPEGHEYAFDVCEDFNAGHPNDIPMYVRFTFSQTGPAFNICGKVLRLRGVPFQADVSHVIEFLSEYKVQKEHIAFTRRPDGKANGEVFAIFRSGTQAERALDELNKQEILGRYIELFRASQEDFDKAARTSPAGLAATGDLEKDELVARVKQIQRSGPNAKEQWYTYCDASRTGNRDPARHSFESLRTFSEAYDRGEAAEVVGVPMASSNVLRLRGVPFQCGAEEVVEFLKEYDVDASQVAMGRSDGKKTGEAFVAFASTELADQVFEEKQRHEIQGRYIEFFKSSTEEMDRFTTPAFVGSGASASS
ncbi:unnamed protein product, partial [Polarella glacialis]